MTAAFNIASQAHLELLDDVLSSLKLLKQGTAGNLLASGLCHAAVSQRPTHCCFSLPMRTWAPLTIALALKSSRCKGIFLGCTSQAHIRKLAPMQDCHPVTERSSFTLGMMKPDSHLAPYLSSYWCVFAAQQFDM